LPGRFQVLPGRPAVILDVAHNPHAARALAQALAQHAPAGAAHGRTHAVFGMLRDKDAPAVVAALQDAVDAWHLVPTDGERGLSSVDLARSAFGAAGAAQPSVPAANAAAAAVHTHDSVAQALALALESAGPDDRIIVFGSFVIVAEALRCLERRSR